MQNLEKRISDLEERVRLLEEQNAALLETFASLPNAFAGESDFIALQIRRLVESLQGAYSPQRH